jgi:hypothetical protein
MRPNVNITAVPDRNPTVRTAGGHCNRHSFASKLRMFGVVLRTDAELLEPKALRWLCGALILLRRPNLMSAIELRFISEKQGMPLRTPKYPALNEQNVKEQVAVERTR